MNYSIHRLIGFRRGSSMGLGIAFLRTQLGPLYCFAQSTLKVSLGVGVPDSKAILTLELLDNHTQLRIWQR